MATVCYPTYRDKPAEFPFSSCLIASTGRPGLVGRDRRMLAPAERMVRHLRRRLFEYPRLHLQHSIRPAAQLSVCVQSLFIDLRFGN
jgi:hypothetical protein